MSSNSLSEMNNDMLEVWKDYLELCSIFLNKAEDIRANEELSVNLELVRASITDLSINITNFKDLLSSNSPTTTLSTTANTISTLNPKLTTNQTTEISSADCKKLVALFFLFLMKIDKESLLNNKQVCTVIDDDNPDLD